MNITTSYDNIRNQLLNSLSKSTELKGLDLSQHSTLSYIINSQAALATNILFYSSMVYNEGIMINAQLPDSILGHARFLGYDRRVAVPEKLDVIIMIPTKFKEDSLNFVIPIGQKVKTESNIPYEVSYQYDVYVKRNNSGRLEATVFEGDGKTDGAGVINRRRIVSEFKNNVRNLNDDDEDYLVFLMKCSQVSRITDTFRISPSSENMEYTFYSEDIPVIKKENEKIAGFEIGNAHPPYINWEKFDNIYMMNPTSNGYVLMDKEKSISITFGNGLFGKKPERGAIFRYTLLLTMGEEGAVREKTVTKIDQIKTSGGAPIRAYVANYSPSYGGIEEETYEEVKRNAIISSSMNNRLVTERDFNNMDIIIPEIGLRNVNTILKRSDLAGNHINIYGDMMFGTYLAPCITYLEFFVSIDDIHENEIEKSSELYFRLSTRYGACEYYRLYNSYDSVYLEEFDDTFMLPYTTIYNKTTNEVYYYFAKSYDESTVYVEKFDRDDGDTDFSIPISFRKAFVFRLDNPINDVYEVLDGEYDEPKTMLKISKNDEAGPYFEVFRKMIKRKFGKNVPYMDSDAGIWEVAIDGRVMNEIKTSYVICLQVDYSGGFFDDLTEESAAVSVEILESISLSYKLKNSPKIRPVVFEMGLEDGYFDYDAADFYKNDDDKSITFFRDIGITDIKEGRNDYIFTMKIQDLKTFAPYKFPSYEIRMSAGIENIYDMAAHMKSNTENVYSLDHNDNPVQTGINIYEFPMIKKSFFEKVNLIDVELRNMFERTTFGAFNSILKTKMFRMMNTFMNIKYSNTAGHIRNIIYNKPTYTIYENIPYGFPDVLTSDDFDFPDGISNGDVVWFWGGQEQGAGKDYIRNIVSYQYNGKDLVRTDRDSGIKIELPVKIEVDVKMDQGFGDRESAEAFIKSKVFAEFYPKILDKKSIYRSEIVDFIMDLSYVKYCHVVSPVIDLFYDFDLEDLTKKELEYFIPETLNITRESIKINVRF